MVRLAAVTIVVLAMIAFPREQQSASGQVAATSTPLAPTATPPPTDRALLQLTRRALQKKKTVRVSQTALSSSRGSWNFGVTWTDYDLASNEMHSLSSIRRVDPGALKLTMSVEGLIHSSRRAVRKSGSGTCL